MPERKKSNPAVTVLTVLLLVIAIGVFVFAAVKLYGYYAAYKKGQNEYQNLNQQYVAVDDKKDEQNEQSAQTETNAEYVLTRVEELENPDTVEEKKAGAARAKVTENLEEKELPRMKNPINFTELQSINGDIMGWVRVGGIEGISYPIAQAKDNEYYLHRTFRGEENFAGCIFLNCYNTRFLTDQNTIIYGHNMKDGSMFGSLKNMQKQEIYDANPYFWIFTPSFIYQYRIFSTATVSASGEQYETRFTKENFQSFIDHAKERSGIDAHGVSVGTEDRVATLSTCTGDSATRFIVQGVLEQIYAAE